MPHTRALAQLERIKDQYGDDHAAHKRALLRVLARARLRSAPQVERLHEVLCFLRAYPDDAALAGAVERMLRGFSRRADLRAHAAALADSGIAGTTIHYRFFWPTARWLARRWPREFHLDRSDEVAGDNIAAALPLLLTPAEAPWLREQSPGGFEALDRLCGRGSDAAWLVHAIEALAGDDFTHERLFDGLDPSCLLRPGRATPSRTLDCAPGAPAVFRAAPLRRARPELRAELARAPQRVRTLGPRAGQDMIDLARGALITRQRDLDAFAYGDARDVRMAEDGGGLAFVLVGMRPERRTLLAAAYGILTLQNGVPIGYSQADILAGSAALSFNTFASFRGGEAGYTFARLLAVLRHLFRVRSFSVEPYQLGHHNAEGIATGAWWFYFKLGFRPRAAGARQLARRERARMQRHPQHRSSPATLRRLATAHLFLDLDAAGARGLPPLADLGRRVSGVLAQSGARAAALDGASAAMLRVTGQGNLRGFTAAERLAWRRWSPLMLALPGLARWSPGERRELACVLRAKGGRRESDFAARFAAHPRLMRALYRLAP